MVKNIKRATSLSLASLMIFLSCISVFATGTKLSKSSRVTFPTVYVHGYGDVIYADANDPNSEQLFTGEKISPTTISTLLSGFITPLIQGVATGDWSKYCDFFVNTVVRDFGKYKLDENGEPSDGSGNACDYDKNITDRKGNDGKYDLFSYAFKYDWRTDPVAVADQLNEYIKQVKTATGYEKVNLVGRCLGGNIVMAYLYKYGYKDVNALELYIGLFDGNGLAGSMFSGKVTITPTALGSYAESASSNENDLISLLKSVLVVLNAVDGLDLPIDIVHKVYEQVYQNIIPRILLESLGTLPCFWSYVNDKYYEDAKKFIFAGKEEKYAKLIEKIDRYHYDVMLNTDNIINNAKANGVNVYNFAKYGGAMLPVCEEATYCNDGVTTVKSQTFGAISSKIDKPFDHEYLEEAEKNGTAKYISADNLIDASGDILRDHTWFIRGSHHGTLPQSVNFLMANVFEANGVGNKNYVTTDYFEGYPQFLLISDDSEFATLAPLTKENLPFFSKAKTVFEHLLRLINRIMYFITQIINYLSTTLQ